MEASNDTATEPAALTPVRRTRPRVYACDHFDHRPLHEMRPEERAQLYEFAARAGALELLQASRGVASSAAAGTRAEPGAPDPDRRFGWHQLGTGRVFASPHGDEEYDAGRGRFSSNPLSISTGMGAQERTRVVRHIARGDDASCGICLCEIKRGSTVLTAPCDHAYHEACLETWLRHHRTCPYCRLDLYSEPRVDGHDRAIQSESARVPVFSRFQRPRLEAHSEAQVRARPGASSSVGPLHAAVRRWLGLEGRRQQQQ